MPIIAIGKEKNLDQLIEKRFPDLSPAELTRVREATLKANPHLSEQAAFKPGTVVVLPEAAKSTGNRSSATQLEGLMEAVKIFVPQLTRGLEEQRVELDQAAKLLKSAAFRKALDGASNEASNLAQMLEPELKREIATNGEASASLPQDIEVLMKDLSGLAKKLAY